MSLSSTPAVVVSERPLPAGPRVPARFPAIAALISRIDAALGARETADVVAALVTSLPALLERHAGALGSEWLATDPDGPRFIELHHCPIRGYQLAAVVWGPGQHTPIFDAGAGAQPMWSVSSIIHGELEVAAFRHLPVGDDGAERLVPAGESILRVGDGFATMPAVPHLHLARNAQPRAVTVSVHVLARPLDVLEVLRADGDGLYRREQVRIGGG